MGADPQRKDLFVEIGYMKAAGPTSYGGTGAPQVTDLDGHSHLPLLPVLESVGAAFANAVPVSNPDGSTGISLHFDVGDNYQATPPTTQSPYIIKVSDGARGGEFIAEKSCGTVATETCAFPEWPGTLGWKTGFEAVKNAPVGASGLELNPTQENTCEDLGTCRRRFDVSGRTCSTISSSLTRSACDGIRMTRPRRCSRFR